MSLQRYSILVALVAAATLPVAALVLPSGTQLPAIAFGALLAMLNSCGSGLTVVNINNGFGAGYAASQINALAAGELE